MIYLYLKESPKGLKYIGKTIHNPYEYMGSGVVWKNHIKKNKLSASDIKTTILFQSSDIDLFKQEAETIFSNLLLADDGKTFEF